MWRRWQAVAINSPPASGNDSTANENAPTGGAGRSLQWLVCGGKYRGSFDKFPGPWSGRVQPNLVASISRTNPANSIHGMFGVMCRVKVFPFMNAGYTNKNKKQIKISWL